MKSKKFFLLMLATVLIVSMTGCKAEQKDTESDSKASASETETEPEPEPEPEPTDPEYHFTEKIQARGVLTVGAAARMRTDYIIPDEPEKYGDLAGTRDGYVPEICRRIAEELGVEMTLVEYETVDALLQAAETGEVDIAEGAFEITEDRLALYEMTDSFDIINDTGNNVYLSTAPVSGAKIQSEEDLAHARIAIVSGTAQAENTALMYPEAEMYELASNEEVLNALSAGQADACVFSAFDASFSDQITKAVYNGTVAQSDYKVADADYIGTGLILMKGNEELCQYINELLAGLSENGWLYECYKTEELEAAQRGIIPPEVMYLNDPSAVQQ